MLARNYQVVSDHRSVERTDGSAWRSTGIAGLVPGTGLTSEELERIRLRARAEQAKAVRAAALAVGSRLGGLLGRLTSQIRRRHAVRKAIRELDALDDRLLRDIGISRSDIPAVAAGTADPRLGAPWVRYTRGAQTAAADAGEEAPRKAA